MYCNNCGTQIPEGVKFCPNCGQAAQNTTTTTTQGATAQKTAAQEMTGTPNTTQTAGGYTAPAAWNNAVKDNDPAGKAPKKNRMAALIAVAAIAVIAVVCAVIFLTTGKTTVDLNKYITVKFDGYDTIGTAAYEFDYEAFEEDYADKIELADMDEKDAEDVMEYADADDAAEYFEILYAYGKIDKAENLSNGDKVIFKWDIDKEEAESLFNIKLKYSDMTFTAEKLKEAKTFDPFEKISVTFSGTSPYGQATLTTESDEDIYYALNYEMSKQSELKNGDVITVTVSDYSNDMTTYCLENYGMIPTAQSKEYTVEGLASYVTAIDQIPEDALNKMKAQTEANIDEEYTNDRDENTTVNKMTYIGCYYINVKTGAEPSWSYGNNTVFLVYQIDVNFDFDSDNVHEKKTYYFYNGFKDLMLLADGTCSTDYTNPRKTFNRTSAFDGHMLSGSYNGFEDLDSLFNEVVTKNADCYDYEDGIKTESASGASASDNKAEKGASSNASNSASDAALASTAETAAASTSASK